MKTQQQKDGQKCYKSRPEILREYAQIPGSRESTHKFTNNSVVLVELMKSLQKKLEPAILSTEKFATPFIRGMFAAEGQVALKKWGTLFYISFSSAEKEIVTLLKGCLKLLGITSGKYFEQSRKFPVSGRRNFERIRYLNIHFLHPEKRAKFEQGFSAYKRINVLNGEEARVLILRQLALGPKTYNELAAALGKARTTIQAWHVPILEKRGLIERTGKRGRA